MGWLLLLEYGIAASTVAVGWSGYVTSFLKGFGLALPPELTFATGTKLVEVPGEGWKQLTDALASALSASGADIAALPAATALINLPAVLGILAVTCLLVVGIKESATVNNVIVFIKVAVILLFIVFGMMHVNPENWDPFIPQSQGGDKYGYNGILRAAGVIFFAYVGFEAVSTAAQEAKNPQRDVPIGIIGSLVICTVLYMLVALALTGIVPYQMLAVPDPIAVGVDAIGLSWLAFIVKIGAIAGLSSVMLVLLYAQTRIFYTMSRDGLIPSVFSKVHPKYQTPCINTLLVGTIVAVVAGMTPIDVLGDLVSLGTLTAFAIICFSVIYLRLREPSLHRPFSVPFPKVTPVLGILSCLYLMWGLRDMFLTLKFYFLAGLIIYFVYGRFHSKLRASAGAQEAA
jgi:APA family basic amino acid/polyamine antiporter